MLNRNPANKWFAFTLVELMITIVIIGVLAIIAMPAYRKYVEKSKKAEAYQTLDNLRSLELSFRIENDQFYSAPQNGRGSATNGTGGQTTFVTNTLWNRLGYPIAANSQTYFSYATYAGKFDNAGAAIIAGVMASTGMLNPTSHSPLSASLEYDTIGTRSCNSISTTSAGFGVITAPGTAYDWVFITAKATLNPATGVQGPCIYVMQLMQYTPSNTLVLNNRGFIELTSN